MPKWIEVNENGVGFEVDFTPNDRQTVYSRERTIKRELPPVITNYCCRLCDATEFETFHETPEIPRMTGDTVIGPGPYAGMPVEDVFGIIGYRCPNCSTRFDDPVKFSKNQPAEVVTPTATPHEEIRELKWGRLSKQIKPLAIEDLTGNKKE